MGSKVLLADDSVTIQKVVGIIFANEGYDLTVVGSGDAALAKAREIKPDVMLVDALMPGKNGYEVCREIRQDPALAHISILLMTGAFESVDEEKNRQSGADDFIIKPFESQALIDATNRLVSLTAQRASAPQPAAAAAPAAPVSAPVAAASVAAAAVAAAAVAAAPSAAQVDDIWATGFDEEPAAAPAAEMDVFAVEPPPAATAASADDDLWGAFDMDSIAEAPAAAPQQVFAPAANIASDDTFSFDSSAPSSAEDEFILEDTAPEQPAAVSFAASQPAESSGTTSGDEFSFGDIDLSTPVQAAPVEPEADFSFGEAAIPAAAQPVAPAATAVEDFSFSDVAVQPVSQPVSPAVSLEEDFSTISFDEEPVSAPIASAAPSPEPKFEPEPEPVFEMPAAAPVVAAAVATAAVAASPAAPVSAAAIQPAAAAAAIATFDESQVKEMIASLSRDVIERIVWEVVPDLAETLIKEEIRKLKAGVAG